MTAQDSFPEKLKANPFRRTDLEIEIEVKNARKNWKKGKVSDEDFQKILKTMRHREKDVLWLYAEDQKERKQKLQQLKIYSGKRAGRILPLQSFVLFEDLRKIKEV